MPAALLGAVSCARCGSADRRDDWCGRCAARWLPAASVDLGHADAGALTGVVRASIGRRLAAQLIDLVILLALAGGGAWLLVRSADPRGWLLAAAAVLLLVVQIALLLRIGRTIGRALLGVRAVDDLTGTPVGAVRWLRSGRRTRFLAADLRHGRDPWRLRVPAPSSETGPALRQAQRTSTDERMSTDQRASSDQRTGTDQRTDVEAALSQAERSLAAFSSSADRATGAGVAIVTENGDRHEIEQVLLVGRSPVDPQPGPGRSLLAWPDLSRRLAKTHLMLEWSGTVLWVTDLESLTGTSVATPDGTRMPLAPGVRFAAGIGSVIYCGGRSVTVVPGV